MSTDLKWTKMWQPSNHLMLKWCLIKTNSNEFDVKIRKTISILFDYNSSTGF